jgi:hypothetical protein
MPIASSSEACPGHDPGWRPVRVKENASKQKIRASVLIQSEPKRL